MYKSLSTFLVVSLLVMSFTSSAANKKKRKQIKKNKAEHSRSVKTKKNKMPKKRVVEEVESTEGF